MKEDGAPAIAKIKGTISGMRSDRCRNQSYYKLFIINYTDSYRNKNGDIVNEDMSQVIVGFNEVARKIKDNLKDGDSVYLVGRLKSRYSENRETERFIEVEEPCDITKLPSMGEV